MIACPTKAISMEETREGFLFPQIDPAQCINCGRCSRVCPVTAPLPPMDNQPTAYAAHAADPQLRASGSSGGIFATLAQHILSLGGVVVACATTDDCRQAEHILVTKPEDLPKVMGSKYLQSSAFVSFDHIRQHLSENTPVLFCGTPCQTAGLKSLLRDTDTSNLYTIDLICHGVASPLVWRKYLTQLEADMGSKAVSVQFRNKKHGWKKFSLSILFQNGAEFSEVISKNLYLSGFIGDYFLRTSCYNCQNKGNHHSADITLGDFWGLSAVLPELDNDLGTSLVLINTEAGAQLFSAVSDSISVTKTDMAAALQSNPNYYRSSSKTKLRAAFMRRLHRKPIHILLQDFCGTNLISKLRRKIMKMAGNVL